MRDNGTREERVRPGLVWCRQVWRSDQAVTVGVRGSRKSWCFVHNVQRCGATAAMTAYIMPLVTGIGGVLVHSETFTVTMSVVFAIIILGIFFINRGGSLKKARSS
jgi:drug/metabolite transporter (DMT)-like permease